LSQAIFSLQGHNPDVITCIANLSNDEVFTPPEFADQMLHSLEVAWANSHSGQNIWENSELTFLDPCTKSGVFLREIVKRLNTGLMRSIPDLTERINHIVTKQVFGIGITELTSLLARRTIYCSKNANGVHSIARGFPNEKGNIWFERTEHTWNGPKCLHCGASKSEYGRTEDRSEEVV
jgi:site-specific DNA-methyltransferase (adenine-specific)